MSTAEIRALQIFNTMHLGNVDEEVKRHLVILLMKVPTLKGKKSFSSVVRGLSGAWNDNKMTAEEEVAQIYNARVTDETRNHFDLLIGSTAVANNLVVVTENVKHLGRIPNIEIENWVDRKF